MGGSILPVTIIDGKVYLLFGKERDFDENPGWSDFGGGTDKGETYFETAQREAGEEMTGFLGSPAEVKKLLTKYGNMEIDYKSPGYDIYRVHIFPLPYDPSLIKYYNNNQNFLQQKLNPKVIRDTKILEKTEFRWFPLSSLEKNKKVFRKFYQNIIDLILARKREIEKFAKQSLRCSFSRKRANKRRKIKAKTKTIKKRR
jgi:8-oxo-dGTP pyrophosphatase MutT (NUDIX family)